MAVRQKNETPTTEVQNVTGTTSLGGELDLDGLADDIQIHNRDEGTFNGGVYKPDEHNSSILLFGTGHVTVTGATSKSEAQDSIEALFSELESLGIDVPHQPSVTFKNVVCTADIETNLNLSAIAIGLGLEVVEYHPEHFTGLVYYPDNEDTNITFLLFSNGSVVITGAQSQSQAEERFYNLINTLEEANLI